MDIQPSFFVPWSDQNVITDVGNSLIYSEAKGLVLGPGDRRLSPLDRIILPTVLPGKWGFNRFRALDPVFAKTGF